MADQRKISMLYPYFCIENMDLINLVDRYKRLGIDEVIDHEQFNLISIVHHSTRIEGSTLTEIETQVLINEGLTPRGKPLHESLMVTDHFTALKFALSEAAEKKPVTVDLIKTLNSLVIRNTGGIYNTIFGTVDARTGAFRKGNVSAGATYFPDFDKVEKLTRDLAVDLENRMEAQMTLIEQLNLSFDAHFNLVSIHPFYDGNGRTSRLLMNYIQAWYGFPLALVHNETKADYYQALVDTREKEDIHIFREFMSREYELRLSSEIKKFEELQHPKKGFNLLF